MDSRFRDVALLGLSGVVLAMLIQQAHTPDLAVPNPSLGTLEGGTERNTVHLYTHHLTADPFAIAQDVEAVLPQCTRWVESNETQDNKSSTDKTCTDSKLKSAEDAERLNRLVKAKDLSDYLSLRTSGENGRPKRVNFVGVLMDRSQRAEAAEQRRRIRFAVQSAMESAGFDRRDTDHIGLLKVPPKSLNVPPKSLNVPQESQSGPLHLVPFEAFFKGNPPARRLVSDEWNEAEATVVLWLDEEIFVSARDKVCERSKAKDPLEKVRSLIGLIGEKEPKNKLDVKVHQVLVLGPNGSASLAAMTAELRARFEHGRAGKSDADKVSSLTKPIEIHLVSPVAIIENHDLVEMANSGCTDAGKEDAKNKDNLPIPPQVTLDRWFKDADIQLSRVNALQSSLTSLVDHELDKRAKSRWPGVIDWIGNKTPTKLVVSESQRLYAQKLGASRTNENPVSGASNRESERTSKCLVDLHFFGDINRVQNSPGQGQVSTTAKAPETSTQAYSKKYEAEGPQNYDYVSRLVSEATRLISNPRYEEACGQVASVEIYGGTLPDKLTLVRAFGKAFPQAILVTDHLDARFRDSSHRPFTRNMLVTTPFGLNLEPDLASVRPSFRGSEQTAYAKALHFGVGGHRGNPVVDAWGTACLVELGFSHDHPLGGACATDSSVRRLSHEGLSNVPVAFLLMTVVVGVFAWVSLRMIVRPVHRSELPSVSTARELCGYRVKTQQLGKKEQEGKNEQEGEKKQEADKEEKGKELVQGANVAWWLGWAVLGLATLLLVSLVIYWLLLIYGPLTERFDVKGFPIPISATRGEHLAVFDGVSPIGPAWLRSLSVVCGVLFLWRFNELYVESKTKLDRIKECGQGNGSGRSDLFVVTEWRKLADETTLLKTTIWGGGGALVALALMEFLLWFLGDPVVQSRDRVIGGIAWISGRLGAAILFAMLTIVMYVYARSSRWIENVEKEAEERDARFKPSGGGGSDQRKLAGIHYEAAKALGGGLESAGIEKVLSRYPATGDVGIHLFRAAESTINLKIVEYHTERVARFVYAPFLLLALLVLSTWTRLGPFTWTTGAAVVLVTVIVWQIRIAISWQWEGRRFRASQIRVIERAREEIDLLCSRGKSVQDAEKAASQLLGIAKGVERGVFRDVLHQPYLAALLFPAGAGGVLTLVDRLLQQAG